MLDSLWILQRLIEILLWFDSPSCSGTNRQHLAVSAEAGGHRAVLANKREGRSLWTTISIMLAQSLSVLLLTQHSLKWILNPGQESPLGKLSVQLLHLYVYGCFFFAEDASRRRFTEISSICWESHIPLAHNLNVRVVTFHVKKWNEKTPFVSEIQKKKKSRLLIEELSSCSLAVIRAGLLTGKWLSWKSPLGFQRPWCNFWPFCVWYPFPPLAIFASSLKRGLVRATGQGGDFMFEELQWNLQEFFGCSM